MSALSLARRSLLGAGGAASFLPLLSALRPREARAQAKFPKRLVVVMTPEGFVQETWRPDGGETDFRFRPGSTLEPLAPYRDRLILLDGLYNKVSRLENPKFDIGGGHSNGVASILTGTKCLDPGTPSSVSIDQFVASHIAKEVLTPVPALQVGYSIDPKGKPYATGNNQPVPIETKPDRAWDRVFGSLAPSQAVPGIEALRERRRSILDANARELARLGALLPPEDRTKLEAHATHLREIEKRLALQTAAPAAASCKTPDRAVVSGFDATSRAQIDILVAALACDRTRVASMTWRGTFGVEPPPGSGTRTGRIHHDLAHAADNTVTAGPYKGMVDESGLPINARYDMKKIERAYAEKYIKYLLDQMDRVPEGAGTLLDNSLVLWCSDMADGHTHGFKGHRWVIAGRLGGALRTGRYLKFADRPINDLLITIAQLFGAQVTTFGAPEACTGPIAPIAA